MNNQYQQYNDDLHIYCLIIIKVHENLSDLDLCLNTCSWPLTCLSRVYGTYAAAWSSTSVFFPPEPAAPSAPWVWEHPAIHATHDQGQ